MEICEKIYFLDDNIFEYLSSIHNQNLDVSHYNVIMNPFFIYCCAKNRFDIIRFIIHKFNIDINYLSKHGSSSLHFASKFDNKKIVKMLIKQKYINLNIVNRDGNTPVMLAIKYNNSKIVKMLLKKKNIDLYIKNNYNHTVLDLSVINKNKKYIKYFLQKGVKFNYNIINNSHLNNKYKLILWINSIYSYQDVLRLNPIINNNIIFGVLEKYYYNKSNFYKILVILATKLTMRTIVTIYKILYNKIDTLYICDV